MNEERKKGHLWAISDAYSTSKLWFIGIFCPVLVFSELLQGRVALGLGLAFICVMVWVQMAKRLGTEGAALDRIGNASAIVGLALLVWHYARWWIAYLR